MIDWDTTNWSDDYWEDGILSDLAKLKPEDYYFESHPALGGINGEVDFTIVPVKFYDLYGRLSDLEGVADHILLPLGFCESSESEYEYDGNAQVGRDLLLSAGFIERKLF